MAPSRAAALVPNVHYSAIQGGLITMDTKRVIMSRKKALQSKLNELLQPSAERETIKVEIFSDPLDQLSSAATRELAIHLVDRNSRLASEVRSALTRIDEGTY